MARYYYTDPIEAAYMMKHFKMKFKHHESGMHTYLSLLGMESPSGWKHRIYVHKDSERILNPKNGDLYYIDQDQIAMPINAELCKKWKQRPDGKLIMRGGRHFFSPEEE